MGALSVKRSGEDWTGDGVQARMYTSMKTISLDHPVRVYFKDGECYHDSATIIIANGFPSFVRGKNPDVIYPWENVKHIIRVAEKPAEPDLTERLRASVAAIADERNGAKQETHRLRAEVERLQADNDYIKALHTEKRVALRDALGLTYDNHDHAGLCAEVKRIRAEWDHLSRYNSPEKLARLERRAEHDRDLLAKALGVDARDVDHGDLCAIAKSMQADLASVTEQRDVLKRQLEELRAEMRKPAMSEPKHVEPGGPIWVRVVDVASPSFGCVGRLDGIEWRDGKETWSVDLDDLGGMSNADWPATSFAVIGAGRKPSSAFKPSDYGTGILFNPPSDDEHQQAQNRDKWRATCLANGAKDCTVYFGPGDGVTFVVELQPCLRSAKVLGAIQSALLKEHGLDANNCRLREVRPNVDGVKVVSTQSDSKSETHYGGPGVDPFGRP